MGNVFAEEEIVAVDFLYLLIYFSLCLSDVFACRNTHHHTTAIGLQHAVVVLRSHMEDRAIEELNSLNNSTFRIVARVAFRGKYDADGGFVSPLQGAIGYWRLAIGACRDSVEDVIGIRLEERQHDFSLWVAKTSIELDYLNAISCLYEASIEDTSER